jgi:hypothetical protein
MVHCKARRKLPSCGLQVDGIAVLIGTIDVLMTQDPPPRLDAYGHLVPAPPRSDEVLSPDRPSSPDPAAKAAVAAPVSDGWLFTAVGAFCLDHLQATDPALAAEAARALLHLKWLHTIVKFPRLQVCPPRPVP